MKRIHRLKRGLCLGLAAVLLAAGAGVPARAEEGTTVQEQVGRLEQQLLETQQALAEAQQAGLDAAAAKASYEEQSRLAAQQVAALTGAVDQAQAAVAENENQIHELEAQIETRWQTFREQMAAMQMMNDAGGVALLAQAESLYELLTFADALQQISSGHTLALSELEESRAALQTAQEQQEARLTELEQQRSELEAKTLELAGYIRQADTAISESAAQAQAQSVQLQTTLRALTAGREQFSSYIGQLPSSEAAFVGETLLWPVSSSHITQRFGENGHGGVDVAAPEGTPVMASASGVVQVSEYHQHTYSYGNYVVIDHGGGIKTLYAHLSSRWVQPGQLVRQGDVIGTVGNTGYSFGNHLHFEVRSGGTRLDPMNYFYSA